MASKSDVAPARGGDDASSIREVLAPLAKRGGRNVHDRLRAPAQASTARAAGSVDPPVRSEDVPPEAGVVRVAGSLAVPDNPRGIAWSSPMAAAAVGTAPQPVSRRRAEPGRPGHDLVRPVHPRGGTRPGQRVRRRPARRTPRQGHRWLRAHPRAARAALGYFGASTGAAALWAAAEPGADIAAVVSCGGRPGLADPGLRP
jgi:putative phosphoribosyl transferase